MDRFRNATFEIHDLLVEITVSTLFQGTWLTSLQESLDLLKSLANLFVMVNKYIYYTEVMRTVAIDEDKERKRKEWDVGEDLNRRQERARRLDDVRPQFNHYTWFTQPRFSILVVIEESGLIKLPKMVDQPIRKNHDEYCQYHRTRGYSIDWCQELKDQIKMLIREGHLRRYVREE